MKCGACGNENQPNAKFCVHCGAVLSQALPPSAATVPPRPAGSTIAPRPPPVAEPTANPSATATRPPATTPPPPPVAQAPSSPAPRAAASPPARVEGSPQESKLIIGVIALLLLLSVGGYFGYRMLFVGEGRERVASVTAPKSDASAPASSTAPAKDVTRSTPPESGPASAATPAAAPVASSDQTKSAAPSAPGASEAEPSKSPSNKAGPGSPGAATKKVQPKAPLPLSEPAPPPPVTKAAPPAKVAAAAFAPPEPARPDRWQLLHDALAQCTRENFLARVVCEQRERLKYCEGYWGQVPQCPAEQPKEHAQ